MLIERKQAGVSLVELMIGVAIVVMLLSMGMRSFSGWVQNQRVRVAAEAILNGIQVARVEAVKRNSAVQFKLAGTRSGWAVQTVMTAEQVQARSYLEDSSNVVISSVLPAGATSVSFNGFGRVMTLNPLDNSTPITEIVVADSKSDRPLHITIGSAGNVRMCDPNSATGDPRAC